MSAERSEGSGTVVVVCERAAELQRAGRLDDALVVLEESDLAAHATEPERLCILLMQGKLLIDQEFYADRGYYEAVTTLDAARTLAETLHDAPAGATALDLLGLADYYRVMQAGSNDYSAALGQFQAALAQREELNDLRGVAESLFHVGLVHERLAQYDDALDFYRRAYALASQRGHLLEQSYAARHLAGGAEAKGDLDGALALFGESLTLRRELDYKLLLPLSHIAVGETLLAQNDLDSAAGHFNQAHTLAEGMQLPLARSFSLLALSGLAQARGDVDARREYAERALTRAREDNVRMGIRAAEATLTAITQERT